jgi:hypothetical protein
MQTETQKRLEELSRAASVNNTAGRTGLAYPNRPNEPSGSGLEMVEGMGHEEMPSSGEVVGEGLKAKRKRAPRKKKTEEEKKASHRKRKPKKSVSDLICGEGLIGQGLVTEQKFAPTDGSQNHGVGATVAGAGLIDSVDAAQGREAPKVGSAIAKKKRAPSAYNLFVRKFSKSYKGANLLKDASAAWKQSK